MENTIAIKISQLYHFVFSSIEENGGIRLPKSGVKIIPNIKEKYADELSKRINGTPNSEESFRVNIIVYNGKQDKLGTGDLDNYAKAILDIITKSQTIWKDDKQVDELCVVRKNKKAKSEIEVIINEM